MSKRRFLRLLVFLGAVIGAVVWAAAQKREQRGTVFHVNVNMVQLDVAVTDKKGNYVTGLGPRNFAVYEDGIRQNIATFGEENKPPQRLEDYKQQGSEPKLVKAYSPKKRGASQEPRPSLGTGAMVFVLFDTSNYMYRGFVFAQEAIAEFVRSLDPSDRIAFYSYSRDLFRACLITSDRPMVLHGIRRTVAGDDAALYDALLWTLQDAAGFSGERAVVVFSNGPDNASLVSPEDVRELAQSEGIPIYMISTRAAELDPLSTAIFKRISASTGGKAYFAKDWGEQQRAFASIQDDLAHLYALSYYPQPNPNHGWRKITVKLVGGRLKQYHLRTRSGYRPTTVLAIAEKSPAAQASTSAVGSDPDK